MYNPRHPPPRCIWKSRWQPLTVRRDKSRRSHGKIGDCEQSGNTWAREFKKQKNCYQSRSSRHFGGLLEMTFHLLHTNHSLPKCQAVKQNLFAPWYKGPSFLPSRKSSTSILLRKSTHHQSCSIYGKLSPIGRHPVVLVLLCPSPSYTFWSQPATTDCGCYGARTTNRCICLYARGGDARATRHGIYSTRMRLWSDCF